MSSTPQVETSQAATDVASVVLAAEGVFTELAQLSFSSVGSELTAAVEETLSGERLGICCRFAGKVTAANKEVANTLLEIALSSEFREYPPQFPIFRCSFFVFRSSNQGRLSSFRAS